MLVGGLVFIAIGLFSLFATRGVKAHARSIDRIHRRFPAFFLSAETYRRGQVLVGLISIGVGLTMAIVAAFR